MAMPVDLVIVRHGHSEGNLAVGQGKKGDDSFFTPDFRQRPGHKWRLLAEGRAQAQETGEWIAKNIGIKFDRYYASPYVRTRETAALLNLPHAEWRLDQRLRERDWGEISSMPFKEFETKHPQNHFLKKIDALYWRPPGGESIADVRLRVRSIFDTLHRECEGQSVILVTHGEFMSAARAGVQYLSDEEWLEADENKAYKIHNTHLFHYSRRDPFNNGKIGKYIGWYRSVCPPKNIDSGWQSIERKRFSNEDLLEQVNAVEPIITT